MISKTLDLASGAVMVSTFASLLTAGLGAVNGLATALGAVGVFGAALSSYAGSREALSQDRRNAERAFQSASSPATDKSIPMSAGSGMLHNLSIELAIPYPR